MYRMASLGTLRERHHAVSSCVFPIWGTWSIKVFVITTILGRTRVSLITLWFSSSRAMHSTTTASAPSFAAREKKGSISNILAFLFLSIFSVLPSLWIISRLLPLVLETVFIPFSIKEYVMRRVTVVFPLVPLTSILNGIFSTFLLWCLYSNRP